MATINGSLNLSSAFGDDGIADIRHGTSSSDTINGFGGADELHGYRGNDTINAGWGHDWVHGGAGNDTINGDQGNDTLYGGSGRDIINGGSGHDWIVGGTGYDRMTGGTGEDTFVFTRGDSGPSYADADLIRDFNSADDTVFFTGTAPAGSRFNYVEDRVALGLTHEIGYNIALEQAHEDIGGGTRYAFYTNGHDGYLFADLDGNGTVDTGIELRGLNELSDFTATDIH
jgi:Ca2+-binding RTX toxin-like protein